MPPRPRALVPLVLAVLLAGCGGGSAATGTTTGASPTTTSSTAPAAPAGTPSAAGTTPVCATPADPVPTSGPVARQFGSAQVTAAYAFATGFMTRTTFTEAPLADRQPPQTAFAATEAGLTPGARDSFRVLTAKLESTTENLTQQETADLIGLATFGVASFPGLVLRRPAYRDLTCGKATTDVFKRPGLTDALVVRFPVSGTFLLADSAGGPQQIVFSKKMDLSLAPTGDPTRPWLVDGWRAVRTVDGPKPDPSTS